MVNLVFAGDQIASEYVERIVAVGGTISFTHLAAVRAFIATGQAEGWWDKIVDMSPFFGNNLAAGLTKLVVAPGQPNSYIAVDMDDTNYSTTVGAFLYEDDPHVPITKYIRTISSPEDVGLAFNDITFGFGSDLELSTYIGNAVFGSVVEHPNTPAIFGAFYQAYGVGSASTGYGRCYSLVASTGPTTLFGSLDGIGVQQVEGIEQLPVANRTFDQEVQIFRGETTSVGAHLEGHTIRGNCGCVLFAHAMDTFEQTLQLAAAIRQMHVSGRQVAIGTHDVAIGDSVTLGQGAGEAGSWSERFLALRRLVEPHCFGTNVAVSGLASFGPEFFPTRFTGHGTFPVTRYLIKIGTNDVSLDSDPPAGVEAYKQQLRAAAGVLQPLNTLTVIVTVSYQASGSVDGVHIPQSPEKMEAYVDGALEVAEEMGCLGVDTYRPMVAFPDPRIFMAGPPDNKDLVHLGPEGSQFVAELVNDALEAWLHRYD